MINKQKERHRKRKGKKDTKNKFDSRKNFLKYFSKM